MGLFRKKEKPLFGAGVPQSCSYCEYNTGSGQQIICTVKGSLKNGFCKNYRYDPLMRRPKS